MNERQIMETWKIQSPDEEGFFEVVSPQKSDCRAVYIFRLNLSAGKSYTLASGALEMNAALLAGRASVKSDGFDAVMEKLDSFYVPGNSTVEITAHEKIIMYIGGAVCDGFGKPFFRKFDISLPIGDIHQIHGSGVGEREVMFTCDPGAPASRLLCGLTWSRQGTWTSWPPHQHENDLEEVYCYFDMDAPKAGLHMSYLKPGGFAESVVHTVTSGTMVLAPRGYHPTVATPGTINAYFWVLAAFSHESRRYDLAVPDPAFA